MQRHRSLTFAMPRHKRLGHGTTGQRRQNGGLHLHEPLRVQVLADATQNLGVSECERVRTSAFHRRQHVVRLPPSRLPWYLGFGDDGLARGRVQQQRYVRRSPSDGVRHTAQRMPARR